MTKPISPSEVVASNQIPNAVLEAFNRCISKNWDGRSAVVPQKEVEREILERMLVGIDTIYEKRWLDVEEIYRKAGWVVEYNKPAYDENWGAVYRFKKK